METKSRIKCGNGWPYDVTKKDLDISPIRGSGNGGQNRKKGFTGVRLKHRPTGLVAQATEHRDRPQNLKAAFRKLCDQLVPLMKKETRKERFRSPDVRFRNYHEPDNRVTDSVLGECASYEEVIRGDGIGPILEGRVVAMGNNWEPD